MSFRKITVNDNEYLWKYFFDDDDCQCDSSIVIKTSDKKGKLVIYFRTWKWDYGYCPFNKGVPAIYRNEPVTINLNQPRFISEIISFAFNQLQIDFRSSTITLNNGIELLHDIGYEFKYQKYFNGNKV